MLLYTSLLHRDEALSNPSLSDGTVVNVYPPLDNEEDSSTVMLDRMLQKVGDRMDETKHTGDKITESVTEDEMCEDRMTYQKMTEDSNLHILENQLLDSSLLRLWRTGAMQEAFRSEDDELYDVSCVCVFYVNL